MYITMFLTIQAQLFGCKGVFIINKHGGGGMDEKLGVLHFKQRLLLNRLWNSISHLSLLCMDG